MTRHVEFPQSIPAERALLGAVMLDPKLILGLADVLPEDFYHEQHGRLWALMLDMLRRGLALDSVLLVEEVITRGADRFGGISYVSSLPEQCPSTANVRGNADRVIERARLRGLVEASHELIGQTHWSADDAITHLQQAIQKASTRTGARGWSDGPDLVDATLTALNTARQVADRGYTPGVPWNLEEIDSITGGMFPGQLILVGARPAMGKSALACYVTDPTLDLGPVLYLSLEMTRVELMQRLISRRSLVPYTRMRSGDVSDAEAARIRYESGRFETPLLRIVDQGVHRPEQVINAIVSHCSSMGRPALVIVDHLHRVTFPSAGRRNEELGTLTKRLKNCAKELEVPILALAQLNRGLEARQDKRPMMMDLRESGDLEQEADTIVFLYRDEVYAEGSNAGRLELLVAKQRGGPTGKCVARFLHGHVVEKEAPPTPTKQLIQ